MTSGCSFELVRFRDLPHTQRVEAAALVRAAVPVYYAPLDPLEADQIIAGEFTEPRTELEPGVAAMANGQVAGIICVYPLEDLEERQFNSFQHVLKSLSSDKVQPFMANLRQIRAELPAIPNEGVYLAFIAANENMRGTGLGDVLMDTAVRSADGRPLFLTVRLDNERALNFYRKHRFETVAEGVSFALLRQRD